MIENKRKEKGYLIFDFVTPKEEWKKSLKKAEDSILSSIKVPGFRDGKAPTEMKKQRISTEQVWNAAIGEILSKSDSLKTAMQDILTNENIINHPEPIVEKITATELILKYKAILYPEIEIGDYKNLKAKRKIEKVTNEDVEREVSSFARHVKKFDDLFEGKVENEDLAFINYKGFMDGEPFPGGEAENYELIIGSNTFIPGFEEQLIGKKVGEKVTIDLKFPKEYPNAPELQEKPVKFEVEIIRVKREVPQSEKQQNETLKKFGYESFDHVRKEVKVLLAQELESRANALFQSEAIKEILKLPKTKINLPEELIDSEIEARRPSFEQKLQRQGVSLKEYAKNLNKTEKEILDEAIKPEAESRIKTTLIVTKVSEQEKLKVSDEDIEKELLRQSEKQKIPVDKLRPIIKMEMLKTNILFDKVMDFLAKPK